MPNPLRLLRFALLAVLVLAPVAEAAELRVMTRNIYLGGDIAKPIPARTVDEFEQKNTELWQVVQGTDFPARAKLLAREVRATKPDLIGLQEVALWRRGPNGVKDGTTTPATEVVYDFLTQLQRELRRAGQRYRVGKVQQEFDLEGGTTLGYDVRLTMRDVVLVKVRRGLRVRRRSGDTYDAKLVVATAIGNVNVLRGWAAVDGSLDGERFRFVNTHLEAFLNDTRVAQARELVAGPARKRGTVIVVGDMNSDPDGADGSLPDAYRVLTGAGLRDAWTLARPRSKGYSCCMNTETIKDPPPAPFDHRIDHIIVKPRLRATRAQVIGNDPRNRTASGLWPSDHGGAALTLRLP
jgi:endonuclease/exonuclease/phosphatase family metal-dependent hydrolase